MKYDPDEHVGITKKTYAQIARDYAHRNAQPHVAVQQMLDIFLNLVPENTVLDVGCAEGRESAYLIQKGLDVTGCDLSEDFVEMAKKQCPNNKFVVADMRNLPEDIGTYHGIWACASFLHIPKVDAPKTLQGFHRILNTNGLLYVSVLEGEFDGLRTNEEMGWPERHFSDYTEEELTLLLQHTGFQVVHKQRLLTSWGPYFLHYFCKKNGANQDV